MTAPRAHIPMKVQLAAALLQISGEDGSAPIPYEHAKAMTADQVISLFHRDHYPIRKEAGGPDAHWNLTWRFIGAHRRKTAKIDIPEVAKIKRLTPQQEEFRRKILSRPCGAKRQPTGNFPAGRKLQSRNEFRRKGQ